MKKLYLFSFLLFLLSSCSPSFSIDENESDCSSSLAFNESSMVSESENDSNEDIRLSHADSFIDDSSESIAISSTGDDLLKAEMSYYIRDVELIEGEIMINSFASSLGRKLVYYNDTNELFLEFFSCFEMENCEESDEISRLKDSCWLSFDKQDNLYKHICYEENELTYVPVYYFEVTKPIVENDEIVTYITHYLSANYYSLFEPHYATEYYPFVLVKDKVIESYRMVLSENPVKENRFFDGKYSPNDALVKGDISHYERYRWEYKITYDLNSIDFFVNSIDEINEIDVLYNDSIIIHTNDKTICFKVEKRKGELYNYFSYEEYQAYIALNNEGKLVIVFEKYSATEEMKINNDYVRTSIFFSFKWDYQLAN